METLSSPLANKKWGSLKSVTILQNETQICHGFNVSQMSRFLGQRRHQIQLIGESFGIYTFTGTMKLSLMGACIVSMSPTVDKMQDFIKTRTPYQLLVVAHGCLPSDKKNIASISQSVSFSSSEQEVRSKYRHSGTIKCETS